jgi:hypothetical protein
MVTSEDLKELFDSVLDEFNSQVESEKRLEKTMMKHCLDMAVYWIRLGW